MKLAAISAVNFYRKYLSINKLPRCRFLPTCSQYALDALEKYTFPKAVAKIIWRLLRCHPFSRGGYDPA